MCRQEQRIANQLREVERKKALLPPGLFTDIRKPNPEDKKLPKKFDYSANGWLKRRLKMEKAIKKPKNILEVEREKALLPPRLFTDIRKPNPKDKLIHTLKKIKKQLSIIQSVLDLVEETIDSSLKENEEKPKTDS
jgi:hypothetical protein